MFAELTVGLGSLKAAFELAKSLNAGATQTAVNEVKLALQGHLFSAQEALSGAREAQTAALDRIRDLEQQIAQFEDWEGQKQRYQLQDIWNASAFAYALKPGMEEGEPPHWLCANCFQRRQKSILQSRGNQEKPGDRRGDFAIWACNACKAEVRISYRRKPGQEPAPQTA